MLGAKRGRVVGVELLLPKTLDRKEIELLITGISDAAVSLAGA